MIDAGIVRRDLDSDRVDVAGDHAALDLLGQRQRQNAGAGADIEPMARAPLLQFGIERQQAAGGGAVMAGAESERRLDLDGDVVDARPPARSCEPWTSTRPARTGFSPSRLAETQSCWLTVWKGVVSTLSPTIGRSMSRTAVLIGMGGEVDLHLPGRIERQGGDAALDLESGDRGLGGVEDLARSSVSARAFSPEVESSRTVATVDGRRPSRMAREIAGEPALVIPPRAAGQRPARESAQLRIWPYPQLSQDRP